ncbi:hypothetical protein FHR20_000362 [Sphingomonas leidyi]|uniref:Uncharacterized protein n=1 Tax=Sphingomonas leidyi TaxID=68569 RepID=A0A7X5ZTV6_9SPHN|nr:hypothetical protein [Sphingomonas leidyi]NIJ63431.1 hypothetical protein [Sphingomonas leidyi]
MDEIMRGHAAELREMSSARAADWLLQRYPRGGEAIILLEHISLRKGDYRRLAEQYLAGPSHAHDRAYRLFRDRLGLTRLIRILGETQGRDSRDADLLAYHLRPMLRGAKDAKELREATAFVDALAAS